jgi:hypothetical protein
VWEAMRVYVVKSCNVGLVCVSVVGLVDSVARSATSLVESDPFVARLATSVTGLATSLAESDTSIAESVISPLRSTSSVEAVRVPCW